MPGSALLRALVGGALLSATVLGSAPAWGQPAEPEGDLPAPEEEEEEDEALGGEPLPEEAPLVVTTHGPGPPRSPSQTAQGRDVLNPIPGSTGSDLLAAVPGAFVTQHGGEGKAHQIFFRGFDAVHGQDLEIAVGGVPVNEVSHIHGQGYADLHFVIPEVVERIDTLPGAFDPSQGDFAIAGSLRYTLGLPHEGITLSQTVGSFAKRRLFAAYRPVGQPSGTFLAVDLSSSEGYGEAREAERVATLGQVLVPFTARTSGRLLVGVYGGRFSSPGALPEEDVRLGLVDRLGSYDPGQGGRSQRVMALAELRHERPDDELMVAPYVIGRRLALDFDFTGFLVDPIAGDATIQRQDSLTVGLKSRYAHSLPILSDQDRLGGGIDVRQDFITQQHHPRRGDAPPLVDAGVRATDVGAYADLSIRPIPRVMVRGGMRFDALIYGVDDHLANESRAAHGFAVTPKVTVDVGLAPGLDALAAYGQGFRSPQARNLQDGEATPFARMNGWELGLRYDDRSVLRASLSGYVSLLDQDLVFNETLARNEEVPGTLRIGGATNLELRPQPWLLANLSGSLTRATLRGSNARFDAGDLVPFVPQLVMRSLVSATPSLTRVDGHELSALAGLGTSYLHRRPLPYGEIGSDIFLVDLQAGLRLDGVLLRFDVDNLLDRPWNDAEFVYASSFDPAAPASLIPRRHFTAGSPRRFLATLVLEL
ncbi:MAG: TonB-dependent receptor [Myxococcales bacterium]|nr:TonB-dependent receptor [Myxococcales bacterium]